MSRLGCRAGSSYERKIPLIGQVHRLMHLWKEGELSKVDDYLDSRTLLRNYTLPLYNEVD